jgi:hypothetical protein
LTWAQTKPERPSLARYSGIGFSAVLATAICISASALDSGGRFRATTRSMSDAHTAPVFRQRQIGQK